MDPRIIEYYKICSVTLENSKLLIDEKITSLIVDNETKQLYLKSYDHAYTIRETVIGAGKSEQNIITII